MKFEKNLFQIIEWEVENDWFTCEIELAENHPIYSGHFPEKAIVPGVCTLAIVSETLSHALQKEVHFSEIKECKFISALFPSKNLRLKLDFSLKDNTIKGTLCQKNEGQIVLKLKATIN